MKTRHSFKYGAVTALLLTVSMLLLGFGGSIFAQTAQPDVSPVFADLDNCFAKAEIISLCRSGVLDGYPVAGTEYFCPKSTLTRAEFARYTVEFLDIDISYYADYKINASDELTLPLWSVPYVKTVLATSFMSLIDGKFDPDGKMTRLEAITLLGSLMIPACDNTLVSAFPDIYLIEGNSASPFYTMITYGIIIGYPDGMLHPEYDITREEFALILYNMAKNSSKLYSVYIH